MGSNPIGSAKIIIMWITIFIIIIVTAAFILLPIFLVYIPIWLRRRELEMKKIAEDFNLLFQWFGLFSPHRKDNICKINSIEGQIKNHQIEIYDSFELMTNDAFHTVIKIDGKALPRKDDYRSFKLSNSFPTSTKKIRRYLEQINSGEDVV